MLILKAEYIILQMVLTLLAVREHNLIDTNKLVSCFLSVLVFLYILLNLVLNPFFYNIMVLFWLKVVILYKIHSHQE